MALFGDDNKKTIEELENYYSNKTQRTGMAWAMAFLSLIITVAVLGGLFFGGRWVYRTFTEDDATQQLANNNSDSEEDSSGSVIGNLGLNLNESQTDGVVDEEAASTDEPNVDRVTQDDEDDVTTDSEETAESEESEHEEGEVAAAHDGDLPDAGAGSVLVAVPAVSMVAGYFVSRNRQLKKLDS